MKGMNRKAAIAMLLAVLAVVQTIFLSPDKNTDSAYESSASADASGINSGELAANEELVSSATLNVVYRSNVKLNAPYDIFETQTDNNDFTDKIVSYTCQELPVYSEPDVKSDKTGIMYSGSEADIIEQGPEWTEIKSGNVTGYVRNVDVLFGSEAEIIASAVGNRTAVVKADLLKVYSEPDSSSDIISELSRGAEIEAYEERNGYILVMCDNGYGYINSGEVDISYGLKTAITIEEAEAIEAAKRAEEARIAAEQAAARAEADRLAALNNQQSQNTVTRDSYTATAEEIHLLAAIIYWESGWEPAEGQLAVANVVLNRVYSPRFKQNTIADVIYAPGQFTGVLDNGQISARFSEVLNKSNEELNVRGCYDAAVKALSGENNIGDMLFFISVKKANYSRYTGYTIINNHCFYVY